MKEKYPGGVVKSTPITPDGPYGCSAASGMWTLDQATYWAKQNKWPTCGVPLPGQVKYLTPGTYTWVAPVNVNKVSAVVVGPGEAGTSSCGGGGGGLGWKNCIPVTPGSSYTIVVGAKNSHTNSYFKCASTVMGGAGVNTSGGSHVGDGGGNGGSGSYGSGGGGAGGYCGNGGDGNSNAASGSDGGCGGCTRGNGCYPGPGYWCAYYYIYPTYYYWTGAGGGGGVNVYGKAGAKGSLYYRQAGSGGVDGGNGGTHDSNSGGAATGGSGGAYGGGGGSGNYCYGGGCGADGAVRLIWGACRAYPSSNVDDQLAIFGQQAYTTPGSYTWVAPAKVTIISVVAVGGGAGGGTGGGAGYAAYGGAGGGGAYKNRIDVTPGNSYSVVVGAGGASTQIYCTYIRNGSNGASSTFDSTTVGASGGTWGTYYSIPGGFLYGDGGGQGGYGGDGGGGYPGSSGTYCQHGGSGYFSGGGGGYAAGGGGGGNGIGLTGTGAFSVNQNGRGAYDSNRSGGCGVNGGCSGTAGNTNGGYPNGGTGGNGGKYGGGGGGGQYNGAGGSGGGGAIRIIWGTGRQFPSSNTADV